MGVGDGEGTGREGGYAWAARVETEQSALRSAFLGSFLKQLPGESVLMNGPRFSDTVCISNQLRSVSTHSVPLNLDSLVWKMESNFISPLFLPPVNSSG